MEAGEDNPPPRRTGEFRIGAKRQERAALAQSGTHGVYGFGSAIVIVVALSDGLAWVNITVAKYCWLLIPVVQWASEH